MASLFETSEATPVCPRAGPPKLSAEQSAIVSEVARGRENLVINARAGTGKTTTMIGAVRAFTQSRPKQGALLLMYNRCVADETKARLNGAPRVVARTLHSAAGVLVGKPGRVREDRELTHAVADSRFDVARLFREPDLHLGLVVVDEAQDLSLIHI